MSEVKYKRVATFIGRVMMSNGDIDKHVGTVSKNPASSILPWVEKLKGTKEKVIPLVLQLTDVEWKKVSAMMMTYAGLSQGSPKWKSMRIEWVHALDTLREFERE